MGQIKNLGITKTEAANDDWLVLQSQTGETYKILKSNLISGALATSDLSALTEIFELGENDFLIVRTVNGTFKIKKSAFLTPVAPVTPDSFLHWSLLENSNSAVPDISGSNRLGTIFNAISTSEGTIFNGIDSLVYTNNGFDQLSSLTIKIKFKTTSTNTQGIWEFRDTQDTSGGSFSPGLRLNSFGNLYLYGYPSSSPETAFSYNTGNFYTALAVLDPDRIRLFVDQVKVIDVSGNTLQPFFGFLSIGYGKTVDYFNGTVKDFQVWNSTFTDAEGVNL
jgi:hypothetical protein